MKARDLAAQLMLNPDDEVLMSSDASGNQFSPVSAVSRGMSQELGAPVYQRPPRGTYPAIALFPQM